LTGERVQRRLAAVLAAEVAGYDRLMAADEEGTLSRLFAIKKTVVDPAFAAHRSRVIKASGDRMLVEFASAVDAVRSAIEVQGKMAEQNAALAPEQWIEFRIGIHVGDIIFDDNDIFGDGVNISPRGSRTSPSPAVSVCRRASIGNSAARSTLAATTSGHRSSRTLPILCGCGGSSPARRARRARHLMAQLHHRVAPWRHQPHRRRRRRWRFPSSRRSRCCRSTI
jgi:hypothetical protein